VVIPTNFWISLSVFTLCQTSKASALSWLTQRTCNFRGTRADFHNFILPQEKFMRAAITPNDPRSTSPRSETHCKDWLQGTPFRWHRLPCLNSPGSRRATGSEALTALLINISSLRSVLSHNSIPDYQKLWQCQKIHSDCTHTNILNKCWQVLFVENAVRNQVTKISQFLSVSKAESTRKEWKGTLQLFQSAWSGGGGLPKISRQLVQTFVFNQKKI